MEDPEHRIKLKANPKFSSIKSSLPDIWDLLTDRLSGLQRALAASLRSCCQPRNTQLTSWAQPATVHTVLHNCRCPGHPTMHTPLPQLPLSLAVTPLSWHPQMLKLHPHQPSSLDSLLGGTPALINRASFQLLSLCACKTSATCLTLPHSLPSSAANVRC